MGIPQPHITSQALALASQSIALDHSLVHRGLPSLLAIHHHACLYPQLHGGRPRRLGPVLEHDHHGHALRDLVVSGCRSHQPCFRRTLPEVRLRFSGEWPQWTGRLTTNDEMTLELCASTCFEINGTPGLVLLEPPA